MRIQKGKPRFSKRELWNLNDTLASIIHEGLVQFRKMERHGFPQEVIVQYLEETKGYSKEQIKDIIVNNIQETYDHDAVYEYFNTLLDKMIFAFSKEAKKEYYEIEDLIEVNSLTDPEQFTEEELKGTYNPKDKTTRILFKPKKGYTKEDVKAYNERYNKYTEELEAKVKEGLELFATYMYSLWD